MTSPLEDHQIAMDGVRALQDIAARMRAHAEQGSARPELWLSVRDLDSLAGRLGETEVVDWAEGRVHVMFNGQDIGVLDELLLEEDHGAEPRTLVTETERSVLDRVGALLARFHVGARG